MKRLSLILFTIAVTLSVGLAAPSGPVAAPGTGGMVPPPGYWV
jgi:hypothetical protein